MVTAGFQLLGISNHSPQGIVLLACAASSGTGLLPGVGGVPGGAGSLPGGAGGVPGGTGAVASGVGAVPGAVGCESERNGSFVVSQMMLSKAYYLPLLDQFISAC